VQSLFGRFVFKACGLDDRIFIGSNFPSLVLLIGTPQLDSAISPKKSGSVEATFIHYQVRQLCTDQFAHSDLTCLMTLKIFSVAKAVRSGVQLLAVACYDRGKSEFAGNRT